MEPISVDLRERIVALYKAGGKSCAEVARHFTVSKWSVERFVKKEARGESLDPKPHSGGPKPTYGEPLRERLRKQVEKHPDATLEELREALASGISTTRLHGILVEMGARRKKKPVRR
jgi:transposase